MQDKKSLWKAVICFLDEKRTAFLRGRTLTFDGINFCVFGIEISEEIFLGILINLFDNSIKEAHKTAFPIELIAYKDNILVYWEDWEGDRKLKE